MARKFKSAAEKRRHEENVKSWEQLKTKYKENRNVCKVSTVLNYSLSNPPGRERVELPSLVTSGGSTSSVELKKYSGDKVLGVAMMHKSNLVPVFKIEEAKDLASMRR